MTTPLLEFKNVSVLRDSREVLHRLSLSLRTGEHVAILGPNGSGKSTLIKTMTRELYPRQGDKGQVFRLRGRDVWDVSDLRKTLGVVTLDLFDRLTRTLTARDAVLSGFFSALGLWPHHRVTPVMEKRAKELLRFLDIAHLTDRPVQQMSSGETRRVMIARALVHDPEALILDEPTNSLDPQAVGEFRQTLRKVARAGKSLILVTHQLHDIIPEIERVILIRDGRILKDGSKTACLTSAWMSRLFGSRIRVQREKDYYGWVY